MALCCSIVETSKFKKKQFCPLCGVHSMFVSFKTLLHHLKSPFNQELSGEGAYYFCSSKTCDVVYFGLEDVIYKKADLRGAVGQKMTEPSRRICYCFDVTYEGASKEIKEFVTAQTKAKNCACEIRNPSGRCCLGDFPKE
jgi:hypothetical protein